jgi:hypothetical protein
MSDTDNRPPESPADNASATEKTIDELFRRVPADGASADEEADRAKRAATDDRSGSEGEASTEPGETALEDNGLAHLVLTVVQLLHEVLERQAIRRMENGSLTDEQIEQIGQTLMRQAEELDRLCDEFDLDADDLEIPIDGLQAIR